MFKNVYIVKQQNSIIMKNEMSNEMHRRHSSAVWQVLKCLPPTSFISSWLHWKC